MQKAIVIILVLVVLGALFGDSDEAADREAEQQKQEQSYETPSEYNPNSADGTYDDDDSCSADPACSAAREELEASEITGRVGAERMPADEYYSRLDCAGGICE